MLNICQAYAKTEERSQLSAFLYRNHVIRRRRQLLIESRKSDGFRLTKKLFVASRSWPCRLRRCWPTTVVVSWWYGRPWGGRVVVAMQRNASGPGWATHVDRDTERIRMVPVLRVSDTDASLAKGNWTSNEHV